ncbi:MAG: hypothetical protein V1753_08555 [Pseudomonadota bacterium]
MWKKIMLLSAIVMFMPSAVLAVEVYKDGDKSLGVSFWTQAWYQYTTDVRDTEDDPIGQPVAEGDLNDFLIRRAYLGINGAITPELSFMTNFAGDKLGMDDMVENTGNALGSGLAVRDMDITAKLVGDNDMILHAGRIYIPFTRNFGTTSTKTQLTTDLDWTQGGLRGSTFYPSKVGRDDGICLSGNVLDDRLQYRAMASDGVEGNAANPNDRLRLAGRASVSILDPETDWFNQGTYLGKKNILSIGIGADNQKDLVIAGEQKDYAAYTVDLHCDHTIGDDGALTAELAYIDINNGTNAINYTDMTAGCDATILSAKAGYLCLTHMIQPVIHYEELDVDNLGTTDKHDTSFYGAGLNYFIDGHANKLSLDVTQVIQKNEIDSATGANQDHLIVTLQMAVGI